MSQPAVTRKIILTAALPYANGSIHLGHLIEYLQADFWTRFQKMRGHECLYICADDTHGTPIMVKAREQKITPEKLIEQSAQEHLKDFTDFQIEFANYSSTNSSFNKNLCEEFYSQLKKKGHIAKRNVDQLYCNQDKMFLPDRFVRGTCPQCSSPDQYGDSCDNCNATYSPTDLKDSACSVCGSKPVLKASEHLFFKLNDFKSYLEKWLPEHTSVEVKNKMLEWFKEDLRDWDISRDDPYFGFSIPGEPGKYFYVWVDAPVGYIASTAEWCQKNNKKLEDYWKNESTEIYHLIGKDISYFHTLFWPALLKAAEYRTPNQVFVHGRLMVNGKKMSKSKGTFINARTYLNHLDPQYLRYYYGTKINNTLDDYDLNFDDFMNRVNSDLVGKIANLGSRGAQMLKKKLDGHLGKPDTEGLELIQKAQKLSEKIAGFYEIRDFAKATTEIRHIVDDANRYFDEKAPWKTLDTDPELTKTVLTTTLNIFRILSIYLAPILPVFADKVALLLKEKKYSWDDSQKIIAESAIGDYEHLATRIEPDKIKSILEQSQKDYQVVETQRKNTQTQTPATGAGGSGIEIDDFMKVDLRIGQIISAESIPEADKLLKLMIDIGEEKPRQIFAGIKAAYKPETLVGRLTIVVANLKPRQMKFGLSEGMVLAAGTGGAELYILSPDSGAKPGQRVK